jgi:hypothetical protein
MNTETLRQIFKSPFDYTTYSREVVHRLFGCHDVASRPEWLDTNAEGDQSFFIGQMNDADHRLLGFFYTRVADGGDVRRKRVGLRKLISPYLKYDVDGAIAVFDDGRHWRLSYICDLKEGNTSAKRFSYILGDENGQYKTPLERLEKVARLNGRLTLSDLRESFSVDALSDEFFDEYHLHYDRIVANLTQAYRRDVPWRVSTDGTSDTRLHDYVKKMMGRIVFLHFLQKKGWLNGNPTFLRDLFCSSPHQADFLEQVLEPLFFGIFNTEPEQREKLFADEQWDRGLLRQWEHLPYLNGGLFERDEVDKMNIRLPASLFNDLFTFLASYNFTVDENDPDDAEIGVDPEMLGKIFESLLEDNKAKGAFYTPKEIVRYMCKESLIAYLNEQCTMNNVQLSSAIRSFVENHELPDELEPYRDILDRALREVKICDPAIGSGAFPMGLLNELWRCREAISTSHVVETQNFASLPSRLYLKKEIIENNIYGVDIEKGAIDIARLRFWLSIVVDSDEPEPLPNFDYKFMQGNSLIESFEGVDLSRMMSSEGQHSSLGKGRQKAGANQLGIEFVSTDTKRNLQLMLREYFSLTDHVKKAEARREINDSVKNYIRHQDLRPEAVARLSSLDPSANQEFFLWHTWFKDIFDKGGFDIVVGNPPYVNIANIKPDEYREFLQRSFRSTRNKCDLYAYFIERSFMLSSPKGIISFIVPVTWKATDSFKKMREIVFKEHSVLQVVNLNYGTFDATVKPMIILMSAQYKNDYWIDVRQENFEPLYHICSQEIMQNSNLSIDTDTPAVDKKLLKAIEENCTTLGNIIHFSRGIKTSNDKRFISVIPKGDEYKKVYRGRNIRPYTFIWAGEYIWYRPDLMKEKAGSLPHSKSFFEVPEKLVMQRIGMQLSVAYDDEQNYFLDTVNVSRYDSLDKNYSLKFLCGLLNSKVVNFWYHRKYQLPTIGGYELDSIPIPKNLVTKQKNIVDLVDKILEAKRIDSEVSTSVLERKIDQLVYELYELTPEEIAIIEKGA